MKQSLTRREFLHIVTLGSAGIMLCACAPNFQPKPNPPAPAPTLAPTSASTSAATSTPIAARTATPFAAPNVAAKTGFDLFTSRVATRSDNRYLYVESDGMPAYPPMIGIKNWQQQVPLPQPYTGANAWSIPLKPVLADKPISAKTALYTGAIALAVNGIPIFNALNNRGDDALLAGELDEFGGHSGRADDYHYHTAPLHLAQIVGQATPIAWALDGFPIYGLTEPDGSAVSNLDEFNGHFDKAGNYHYHGTKTFPYINGGMRGIVEVRDDQVMPQPRTTPVRPFLQPLRGATVTGWKQVGTNSYSLEYQINGQKYFVNYRFEGKVYTFDFVDASCKTKTETYRARP
jgi:hypothetical protein